MSKRLAAGRSSSPATPPARPGSSSSGRPPDLVEPELAAARTAERSSGSRSSAAGGREARRSRGDRGSEDGAGSDAEADPDRLGGFWAGGGAGSGAGAG